MGKLEDRPEGPPEIADLLLEILFALQVLNSKLVIIIIALFVGLVLMLISMFL